MGNGLCYEEVLVRLSAWAAPESLPGMVRCGILTDQALGVSMPKLRSLAKECGKDHDLAAKLWASGIHEARILASLVEEPGEVSEEQTERWVYDFDSWDLTDQTCASLFRRLPWGVGEDLAMGEKTGRVRSPSRFRALGSTGRT